MEYYKSHLCLQTCLFGLAGMLWSAADFKMPANQEPAISQQLENLLSSMIHDQSERRPSPMEVLLVR